MVLMVTSFMTTDNFYAPQYRISMLNDNIIHDGLILQDINEEMRTLFYKGKTTKNKR